MTTQRYAPFDPTIDKHRGEDGRCRTPPENQVPPAPRRESVSASFQCCSSAHLCFIHEPYTIIYRTMRHHVLSYIAGLTSRFRPIVSASSSRGTPNRRPPRGAGRQHSMRRDSEQHCPHCCSDARQGSCDSISTRQRIQQINKLTHSPFAALLPCTQRPRQVCSGVLVGRIPRGAHDLVKLRDTEGVSAVVSLNEEVRDPARQLSSCAAPLCPSMAGDWSN